MVGGEVRDRATRGRSETIGFTEKRPLDALNLHEESGPHSYGW